MLFWAAVSLYAGIFAVAWARPGLEKTDVAAWFLFVGTLRIATGATITGLGSVVGSSALLGSFGIFPWGSPYPYTNSPVPVIYMMVIGALFGLISFGIVEGAFHPVKWLGIVCGIWRTEPPAMTDQPRQSQLQFSVRTLLISVVFLSLPFSWVAVMRARVEQQRKLHAAVQHLYPSAEWSLGYITGLRVPDRPDELSSAFQPYRFPGDGDLADLTKFTNLRHLDLSGCSELTDAGLAHLGRCTKLEHLNLSDCPQVTDAGLVDLGNLASLQALWLEGTQVTVEGVMKLRETFPECQISY